MQAAPPSPCRRRILVLGLMLALTPARVTAQADAPPPRDATADVILAPPHPAPAAAPADPGPRSPGEPSLSLEVSAVMPGYRDGASTAPAYPAGVDLRTVDKPRNQILRLPAEMLQRYVVHASRVRVFQSHNLLSKAGLIDLSFQEHPGLRFGNFFNLNAPYAYEVARQEHLASARQDLAEDTLAIAAGGDADEEAVMQQDILDASFAKQSQSGPVGIK